MMASCRSCGQMVAWVVTVRGETIPVDAAGDGLPVSTPDGRAEATGRTISVTAPGRSVSSSLTQVRLVASAAVPMDLGGAESTPPPRFQPHWVTCPKASEWADPLDGVLRPDRAVQDPPAVAVGRAGLVEARRALAEATRQRGLVYMSDWVEACLGAMQGHLLLRSPVFFVDDILTQVPRPDTAEWMTSAVLEAESRAWIERLDLDWRYSVIYSKHKPLHRSCLFGVDPEIHDEEPNVTRT